MDERDRELARRFEELRREDLLAAPDFGTLLARPPARGDSRRRRRLHLRPVPAWLAAGAVVGLVGLVGVALRVPSARSSHPSPDGSVTIAAWKSPTDFLLDTPGRQLLDELPEPPAAVPPWALASPAASPRAPLPPTPLEKGASS
jgi:hypothetical protein